MTECSALPTAQYSGHPSTVTSELPPAHGVNAVSNPMQPAAPEPMLDRATAQATLEELRPADDAVLVSG